MTMVVTGFAEFNKRILNLISALPDELDRAIVAEGDEVLRDAKKRCPWETEALRDSGMLTNLSTRGSFESKVQISFGSFGQSSVYANYVHENLSARHYPPYGNGGEAKFLENAVNAAKPGMSTRIGERIKLERLM